MADRCRRRPARHLVALARVRCARARSLSTRRRRDADLRGQRSRCSSIADTFAPLDTPEELPLKVTRHIDALGSKSSYSKVVVSEKIDFDAGGEFAQKQDNQYVMDRRSMRTCRATTPTRSRLRTSSIGRRPSGLNFPLDTDPDSEYLIYKNEVGRPTRRRRIRWSPTLEVDGLHLVAFAASPGRLPITRRTSTSSRESVPLPKSLTITQLTPLLLCGRDRCSRHACRARTRSSRPRTWRRSRASRRKPVELVVPRHVQRQRCGRARDRSDRRREGPRRDDLGDGRVRGRVAADHRRAAALPAGARGDRPRSRA